MSGVTHILVESGPDEGKRFEVPVAGCRLGRSSSNDITVRDPSLSRFHCRFYFDDKGTLMVSDLGSANQTILNGRPIMESRLSLNDRILIGDTTLAVIHDGKNSSTAEATIIAPAGAAPLATPAPSDADAAPLFDLGLGGGVSDAATSKEDGASMDRRPLYLLLALAVLIVLGVFTIKAMFKPTDSGGAPVAPVTKVKKPAFHPVEIRYEKVQADNNNIFRYFVTIHQDDTISAEIDNLLDNRHITERDKSVSSNVLANLARSLKDTGFFDLDMDYRGHTPDVHHVWDLSITIANEHHRVVVQNTLEPDEFKAARELFEEFCENELGLIALSKTPEELTQLAREAQLLAQKLYDGRDVAAGNLADCITSCNQVKWYLQTIDPKPDFHSEALVLLNEATEELNSRFRDNMFLATRAMTAKEWHDAASHLQDLVQMLHESDERLSDVRQKLVVVNNQLDAR